MKYSKIYLVYLTSLFTDCSGDWSFSELFLKTSPPTLNLKKNVNHLIKNSGFTLFSLCSVAVSVLCLILAMFLVILTFFKWRFAGGEPIVTRDSVWLG